MQPGKRSVAILGASGYAGIELTRIVALHPSFELAVASSDRWAGDSVEQRAGIAGATLPYVAPDAGVEAAAGCDLVFCATPAEVSHGSVAALVRSSARIVDLSGAYRLRDATAYPTHYGFAHAHPELLGEAVYGLPELGARAAIARARLVANPGCYATAVQLALAPLRGLVGDRLVVDAMSGVTGAGRRATEAMSFAEVEGDVHAYRALHHQHVPEIEQALGLRDLVFVPHLLPIRRGILATCHAELTAGCDPAAIAAAFERYATEPFVTVAAGPDAVTLRAVVGTNRCVLGVATSGRAVVVIAAIDNLVKGAAGQAVQNANLMLGMPETAGLDTLRSNAP